MILNASAKRITFVRFAQNFSRKLMTLVDLTSSTAESNGLYVNYYGNYATIASILRDQCTVHHYASLCPLGVYSGSGR